MGSWRQHRGKARLYGRYHRRFSCCFSVCLAFLLCKWVHFQRSFVGSVQVLQGCCMTVEATWATHRVRLPRWPWAWHLLPAAHWSRHQGVKYSIAKISRSFWQLCHEVCAWWWCWLWSWCSWCQCDAFRVMTGRLWWRCLGWSPSNYIGFLWLGRGLVGAGSQCILWCLSLVKVNVLCFSKVFWVSYSY